MDGITNFGGRLYIAGTGSSPTAQNADLNLSAFQALTDWIQLPNVGSIGETGINQNAVNYPTWDRRVLQKGKGQANAGDPEVECLDVASDGMTAFIAAGDPNNQNNYAFRIVWDDGTVEYNRGLVMGPRKPKGGNEEFKRVVFTLALQQQDVTDTIGT